MLLNLLYAHVELGNNIRNAAMNRKKRKQKKDRVKSTPKKLKLLKEGNLEFCKEGYALFFEEDDATVFYIPEYTQNLIPYGGAFCDCRQFKKLQKCGHTKSFLEFLENAEESHYSQKAFEKNLLYKTASLISPASQIQLQAMKLQRDTDAIIITDSKGINKIIYFGVDIDDISTFHDRFTKDQYIKFPRGKMVDNLLKSFLSENDISIISEGYITPRLLFDFSIWKRFFYHLFHSFNDSLSFFPIFENKAEEIVLTIFIENHKLAIIHLPISIKTQLIDLLSEKIISKEHDTTLLIKAQASLNISISKSGVLNITPLLITDNKIIELNHFPPFDRKIYLKDSGFMQISAPNFPQLKDLIKESISKDQIPEFLNKCGEDILQCKAFNIASEVRSYKIINDLDEFELINPRIKNNWCEFSLSIPVGSTTIPIYDIVREKQEKRRYLKSKNCWIDLDSVKLKQVVHNLEDVTGDISEQKSFKLSKMQLLRMVADTSSNFKITGNKSKEFNNLLNLKPAHTNFNLKGMNGKLRNYQVLGLKWLTFLAENQFGGLLCDDMGLGKTHQVMAFLLLAIEKMNFKGPFLVVCPTTVLSHWVEKIKTYSPGLEARIFHGNKRELRKEFKNNEVLITSYGVLRNDIEDLEIIQFGTVVYDEIHYLKNKKTLSAKAALRLNSNFSIGLTGTPIENHLFELKALMDIVLPGYLGTNLEFERKFIIPEKNGTQKVYANLHKSISPFTMRRLKMTVLDELPPKIEDTRTCQLSKEQLALYKKAIQTQGKSLREAISDKKKNIPYMHVFALLDMLKQICNHPALVENKPQNYDKYESGKWELFKEILAEVLDSGHKVVIFSQYLGIIEMIRLYLTKQEVSHVILTGKTTNREKVINTFNTDEKCKVFIGSLKAGGTGIDLIAASIVIHYDRWWNAAKEDQATDRVHRIGQTKGVQVFKFITLGTLEEKISKLIDAKREILSKVIREDSPDGNKIFTREELLDLLI